MSGNKRLTKVQPVIGFSSSSTSKPPSSVKSRSTVNTQPASSNLIPPSVVAPLVHSKAKARSQEDLTKLKDRPKTKAPQNTATSSGRRPGSAKDAPKAEKLREKNKVPKSSSSSTSSSSRSSSLMARKPKEGAKSKSDGDKSNLEGKIKDLMGMAKTKDSEIRSLKSKLDHMMHLLNKQNDDVTTTTRGEFTSLVKLVDDELDDSKEASVNDLRSELARLQDENMKLREQVDTMMTSLKDKELDKSLLLHQHKLLQDADALSTDDVSSIDDVASATSGDALRSLSRCTSADNLLDDVSTSGTTSSNGRAGCHGDDCVSESSSVTVACLTERIHQMEESHISTNEELEATVQELTDLQKSVPELAIDNRRLEEEKEFLETKLQIAEKRLAEESAEASHLRALVSDRYADGSNHSDLQQQYMILLNEREQLLRLHDSISKESRIAAREKKEADDRMQAMQERMRHLERELNHSNTERSLLDKKLKSTKDTAGEGSLKMLQKLEEELQSERQRNEKFLKTPSQSEDSSEVIEVLRHENQNLEGKCLLLEGGINQCQHENEKLDARVAELEEEQEATNARTKRDLSELSELIDRLQEDLRIKQADLDEANDTLFVMEDSVEQHIAVKKHDNHIIQQLQNQISSLKEERFRLEKEIQQLKKEQRNQSEEWKQFQADLQMAVIIANDMKAETQSEVSRLRESNQLLDEQITKIRVENEQLRRKRISNVSASPAAILEAAALRQSSNRSSTDIAALRENFKRRASENSPGVQTLIKSFDSHNSTGEPTSPTSPSVLPTQNEQRYSPVKSKSSRSGTTPMTATVSPLPRHQSMSAITISSPPGGTPKHHGNQATASPSNSSKPGTPESGRSSVSASDLSQLSSLLRRNSVTQESRKASDTRKQPLTDILDRLAPTTPQPSQVPPATASTPAKHCPMSISTPSDPLASLARRYGGSKRNALLKWCQEKTQGYPGIDITNFSSSWSDGLALCALLHSYLPAHIPYESLRQTYDAANDEGTRQQLQAKNFRLAFAAAESVGIDPTLTKEEMTTKERPDWQRVMAYVTQIYKYFET